MCDARRAGLTLSDALSSAGKWPRDAAPTSDALEDRVREVALSTPEITGIVLDCEGIDFIDSQGSAKMREILDLTEQAGVVLRLARIKPAVRELLTRDGVLDRIGDDKTYDEVDHAVAAQMAAQGGSRADL
jgi:SulP family sulfate permease